MDSKDYNSILDSLPTTGVYVIREDNHQILYFNKYVKELTPHIEVGMVCHELWKSACENCPLINIKGNASNRSVHYDGPFGKAVDIAASRTMWQDRIPAFIITITPHTDTVSFTYSTILRVNLSTDTYESIKCDDNSAARTGRLTEWLYRTVKQGVILSSDILRFQKFTSMKNMKKILSNDMHTAVCTYRRRVGSSFRWHTMEIVPDSGYTPQSETAIIYIKDVHDIYRKGLELEEINIQNLEVIQSLSEQNFGIYVIDLRTGMMNPVRISPDVEKLFQAGIRSWTDIFPNMLPFFHPDYRKPMLRKFSLQGLNEACRRGEKKTEMLCLRKLDSHYRYVSTTAYFRDSRYVVLTIQDVDARTKQEMQRQRNDRKMAVIIRSRYNIMNQVDLETGICERIYLNKSGDANRIMTDDYESHIQKAAREAVHADDAEKFKRFYSIANLREKAKTVVDYAEQIFQYRLNTKPLTWVEAQIFFIRQDDKILVSILSRDVTKEKLLEEAYNAEIRERSNIINSLSDMFSAIYYVELSANTISRIMRRNGPNKHINETQNLNETLEHYVRHYVHPDFREEYSATMNPENLRRNLNKNHTFLAIEYPQIRETKDGFVTERWIRASAILVETNDEEPEHLLYVMQNITESKQKEEREHQALKEACDAAIHANTAKSEFLSRMSHDIRTPMNAIIGMTAMAATHLDNPERVTDCLNKITISSRHLLSLINEVLDMSKIESGKIDLAEEEFNLSDLVENVLTIIRPSVEAKQQHLEFHIANVEHEDVIGDMPRLQQVFMNILGNAVKYTPENGRLELLISEKKSSVFGYACFEFIFRDTGIGMSEEFLKRIFEPFSRAEDSRVSKIEGTGLGMAIALNIVHMMNGSIHVESRIGEGSSFTVTVFLKQQSESAPDTKPFTGLPVLVVDDDIYACESACSILNELGMDSEWTLNGREAVKRVRKRHRADDDFFAIILDWKMPEMDGLQTAQEIRREVGPDLPIIILSGYDWSNVETEAREIGIDFFISKPLFKSRLSYLFKKLVEGDTAESVTIAAAEEADFTGKRILLVEDNDLNREIAEEIIGNTGVTVESAVNGKEAVNKYLKMGAGYYDLIFMDIQMPVMNGYDATRAIRNSDAADAKQIPIIAMTANAFMEDMIASKEAGMNEHITKPLDFAQLRKCMAYWLKK